MVVTAMNLMIVVIASTATLAQSVKVSHIIHIPIDVVKSCNLICLYLFHLKYKAMRVIKN